MAFYDDYARVEEEFGAALEESLHPRGPQMLYDVVAGLGLSAGGKAVDVGCGEGRQAVELAQRLGFEVLGVDPVPWHVDLAQQHASSRLDVAGRISFTCADAEQLPVRRRGRPRVVPGRVGARTGAGPGLRRVPAPTRPALSGPPWRRPCTWMTASSWAANGGSTRKNMVVRRAGACFTPHACFASPIATTLRSSAVSPVTRCGRRTSGWGSPMPAGGCLCLPKTSDRSRL